MPEETPPQPEAPTDSNAPSALGARPYLANVGYLFGAKLLQMIVSFTVGALVARHLGPTSYGTIGYALNFVVLASGFASLGLDAILIRTLVRGTRSHGELLGTAFVLRLTSGLVLFVALTVATFALVSDGASRTAIVILGGSLLFDPFLVIDMYFQSQASSKFVVFAQSSALLVCSAARLACIAMGALFYPFVVLQLVETALVGVGLLIAYAQQRLSWRAWRFRRDVAKELLGQSWPLAINAVLTAAFVSADQLIVNGLLGAESLGYYAAAQRISATLYFVPVAICQSFFPALVAAKAESKAQYGHVLQRLHDGLFWAALLLVVPISLASGPIIRLLYGAQFSPAGAALGIHIWTCVPVFLGVLGSNWLVAEDLERFYPLRLLATLVAGLALSFLLIPRLGISGAAWGAVLSRFVAASVVFMFARRTLIVPLSQLKAALLPLRMLLARRPS